MAKFLEEVAHYKTYFHHCMYGSARRKHTCFVHNIVTLCDLAKLCDDSHTHEPWGHSSNGWATAEETAYPWPLCRRVAALVALHIQSFGVACPTPTFATHASQLDAIRQQTLTQVSNTGLPWVSEFKEIIHLDADTPVPANARVLSTPAVGHVASATKRTVGVYRSPEEFILSALESKHPGYQSDELPEPMQEALQFCAAHDEKYVANFRSESLRAMISKAQQLDPCEREVKAGMSERRLLILRGKRLMLFKDLLQQSGSQDVGLSEDISAGFDLTGKLPESHCFGQRYKPASIPTEALRNIANRARTVLLRSIRGSGDSEVDNGVYAATIKEREKGFLKGPIPVDQIPDGSTLTRRFGVQQKGKVRPIDDYKASMVNAAVTQVETVTLHGVDHIAGLSASFLQALQKNGRSETLVSKCWDLASAYKQIPLSDEAYRLDSYIVVYNPLSGLPEVFQQAVLPFGSVASVTAFLRCALGVWHIGSKLLMLLWTSYFDDFLSVTTKDLTRHTEICISTFFHLLGCDLSTDKLVPYSECCKVLGVELAFYKTPEGVFEVRNTPERAEELTSAIQAILRAGTLKRAEGERLRGRLQFASNQLFRRRFRNCLRELNAHLARGLHRLNPDLEASLQTMAHLLSSNAPRQVDANFMEWVHLYVDASFDSDGYSGVGGVLFDSTGRALGFFSEKVEADLLASIMSSSQETAILELEGLAVATALDTFRSLLKSVRVVVFTDNQSVQACIIKCKSNNLNLDLIIRKICSSEESLCTIAWIERVPSYSNPADKLSREECELYQDIVKSKVDLKAVWESCTREERTPSLDVGGERETEAQPRGQKERA